MNKNKENANMKKTETVTFRLPVPIIEELKREANLEKNNLNALVLKLLSNHLQWGRYERKVGLLPMTRPFVKYAISKMTEEEITNMAQKIEKETVTNILIFTKGHHSTSEFIDILRSWLNVAWMQHYVEVEKEHYIFKIQHDLGDKWSLYVKTMVYGLAHDVLVKKIDIKTTESTITLIFPLE